MEKASVCVQAWGESAQGWGVMGGTGAWGGSGTVGRQKGGMRREYERGKGVGQSYSPFQSLLTPGNKTGKPSGVINANYLQSKD